MNVLKNELWVKRGLKIGLIRAVIIICWDIAMGSLLPRKAAG